MTKRTTLRATAPGACLSVKIDEKLYGAARITGESKFGPTLEAVDWFGAAPPTVEDIRLAKLLALARPTAGLERGPIKVTLVGASVRLPKHFAVVGHEPRIAKKSGVPHVGLYGDDVRRAILLALAVKKGSDPVARVAAADARRERAAAKKEGLTAAQFRLREDAREVVAIWRAGEYDNLKDVVHDVASLLPKTKKALPKEAAALEKVKTAVVRDLKKLVGDPDLGADAKRWLARLARLGT